MDKNSVIPSPRGMCRVATALGTLGTGYSSPLSALILLFLLIDFYDNMTIINVFAC